MRTQEYNDLAYSGMTVSFAMFSVSLAYEIERFLSGRYAVGRNKAFRSVGYMHLLFTDKEDLMAFKLKYGSEMKNIIAAMQQFPEFRSHLIAGWDIE